MKKYFEIDVARARATFDYDAETGVMTRRSNGRVVGCKFSTGHLNVGFAGKMVGVHRIAWAIYHGQSPTLQIDHVNNDPSDNRISNLRLADYSQNNWNKPINRRNKSGVKGVFRIRWHRHGKRHKWQASVCVNKVYHTANFDCFGQAVKRARELRAQLHGEFTHHGGVRTAEAS